MQVKAWHASLGSYKVENVESLATKLQLCGFAKANVLGHREINPLGRRSFDDSATRRPNLIGDAGVNRRVLLEAVGVETLLPGLRRISVGIAEQVRPVAGNRAPDYYPVPPASKLEVTALNGKPLL